MSVCTLRFPTLEVGLQAPREALAAIEVVYPWSLSDEAAKDSELLYRLRRERELWTLSRNDSQKGSFKGLPEAVMALEYDLEHAVIQSARQLVALHAGAAADINGAWLAVGDSGSGKTMSTLHLVELGCAFLCEEIALVDAEEMSVRPHPQSLSIEAGLVARLSAKGGLEKGDLRPLGPRFFRYLPHRRATEPTRIRGILLPSYEPSGEEILEEVEAAAVLTELLGYCFPPQQDTENLFDRVIRLLEAVPVYRFRYRSMASARRLLGQVMVL